MVEADVPTVMAGHLLVDKAGYRVSFGPVHQVFAAIAIGSKARGSMNLRLP